MNKHNNTLPIIALIFAFVMFAYSIYVGVKADKRLSKKIDYFQKIHYDTTYIDTLYLSPIGIDSIFNGQYYLIVDESKATMYEFFDGKMITITKYRQ